MMLDRILQIYCIVHILLCLLIWLALNRQWLHFSEQLMPIILLVPVAGMIAAVAAEWIARRDQNGSKQVIQEEIHRKLADLRHHSLNEDQQEQAVPIQEALRINDARTRRRMILEIVRQNPENYIHQLQEACANNDLEVSHYASTAVMELQREYEMTAQQAEAECAKDPENLTKLHNAIFALQRYIDSGMINSSTLPAYRHRLAQLLKMQSVLEPDNMKAKLTAVDNYLALNNMTEARLQSDDLVRRWPENEQAWLMLVKVCCVMRDGRGLQETLDRIRQKKIYLSPEGREIIRFWQNKQEEGVGVL